MIDLSDPLAVKRASQRNRASRLNEGGDSLRLGHVILRVYVGSVPAKSGFDTLIPGQGAEMDPAHESDQEGGATDPLGEIDVGE